MHGLHEQLAVFVRQTAQVDQETRRSNVLHSPAPRSAASASQRDIARELGIDRRKIKRIIDHPT
jgi:pyruvate/2-oxoglutarate dehydrogenase complex dihydrolipoamide acyltransferase (E2) component